MRGNAAKELGLLIAAARRRKGLSQAQLAQELGIGKPETNRAYISAWEHGRDVPAPRRVGPLCRILGMPMRRALMLTLRYRHGPLEPTVLMGMVREETARYERQGATDELERLMRCAEAVRARDGEAFRALLEQAERMAEAVERRDAGKGE